jgi:hypothetical protein
MLFIIAGHMYLGHQFNESFVDNTIAPFILPFFMVAVNCFVLISGWFGIKFDWRKLLSLNWMVTFWTLLIGGFALYFGIHSLNIRNDIMMLAPVVNKRYYWFITVYFALCFMAPYLNSFIKTLSKERLRQLLKVMFWLFVVLPTFGALLNFKTITNDSGYGLINFIFLYFLGRYLRLYHVSTFGKWIDFTGYLISMAVCGGIQLVVSRVLEFSFTSLISYDTLFIFWGAVFLFLFFSKLDFTSKTINWLASFCLAVFVIHCHPWASEWFYQDYLGGGTLHDCKFLAFVFIVPIPTYLICVLLEHTRRLCVEILKKLSLGNTALISRARYLSKKL